MTNSQSSVTTLFDQIHRARAPPKKTRDTTRRVETKKLQQSRSSQVRDRKAETEEQRRTCLIDDWMEKTKRIRTRPVPRLDDDLLFFSSASSHSSSSSSDCERKTIAQHSARPDRYSLSREPIKLDGYNRGARLKSESEAVLKMNADLKKSKLPISPGGKLTSFINSMFNRKRRETTDFNLPGNNVAAADEYKSPKSRISYTCSSASSSTRSCLVNKSHSPHHKPVKKSVRFYPPSIEHSAEIRSRNVQHSERSLISRRKDENLRFSPMEYEFRGASEVVIDEGGDIDDAASDASSELFEIDHIIFAAINSSSSAGTGHELPVFETTNVNGSNRAMFLNGGIVF